MADSRVGDLAPGDLLQRPLGDAGAFCDLRPVPLCRFQLGKDVVVKALVHERDARPMFGFSQPTNGSGVAIPCKPMARKAKLPKKAAGRGLGSYKDMIAGGGQKTRAPKTMKVPGFMRVILAENIKSLMDRHYIESRNRPKSLAKDAGVSLSTIQRILERENGANLDSIEQIAEAFALSAYQLLIPSLDILDPQIVHGASEAERRLYREWRRTITQPDAAVEQRTRETQ